ncbi:WD repeat-containing protein 87-like isoform X2 [Halichondria panicea]|uniref:WD repeat-containing protein 87-like isoform X2 n=1 Tax=Halichondria panicea TaxID=6063 RepID=UPI00312B33BE
MSNTNIEEKEAQNRIRSAPAHILAGRRLLCSRQSKTCSKRRIPGSRGTSRSKSRGNYERSFTSTSPAKPQPKQTLVSTSIVRAPGYTLTRNPTNVRVDINTSTFFGGKDEQESVETIRSSSRLSKPSSKRDSPTASTVMRAAMLEKVTQEKQVLELEIAELHIQMESVQNKYTEKENQKEEEFFQATEKIRKHHQTDIEELEEKHQQEMCVMQDYHNELVKTITKDYDKEIDEYQERLKLADEQLQESVREKEKTIGNLEEELKEQHRDEIQHLTDTLGEEAKRKLEETQAELKLEHRQEIEEITADHETEIDGMREKYNKAMALKDDLQKSIKRNKKLEKEISKNKEKIQAAKEQHTETETQLQETIRKLKELQDDFQEKVWMVETNYRDRIDALKSENTLLRRRLLWKTDEFSDYRANTERLQAEGIRSTREKLQIVLRARQKACLSIAMGTSDMYTQVSQGRPASAPITKSERKNAKLKTDTQ